ncbi:MAG: GNAT family N-acetyltransferase [Deltaproteobacteria bacterium]|nr:GNAT family N-acetyltransferase [Deltaproteobacteria bacterium]
MEFKELFTGEEEKIREMSQMASAIVKEHYDPIIGPGQNDYMIRKFQSVEAIREQLAQGYRYFFVTRGGKNIGFMAFYPRGSAMYLSKFYLYKQERGKGFSRKMMAHVAEEARKAGLASIELNVNKHNSARSAYEKLGFKVIRTEKNDIGHGFFMDDYVYSLEV